METFLKIQAKIQRELTLDTQFTTQLETFKSIDSVRLNQQDRDAFMSDDSSLGEDKDLEEYTRRIGDLLIQIQ